MAVNLQFYNSSSSLLDTSTGLELGSVRRGFPHMSTIYVKNDGDVAAKNVSITSGQIDTTSEDQVIASKWQTFSLDGENFSSTLDLGTIEPDGYATGTSTAEDSFTSASESLFKYILGSAKIDYTSPILSLTQDDATSQAYARTQIALENAKELDFNFTLGYTGNKEIFSALPTNQQNVSMAIFAVRINANGETRDNDNTGYLVEFFLSPKNENMFQLKITKGGKGIAGQSDRSYGYIIGDTGNAWVKYSPMVTKFRFKVYNDEDGIPSFELYKDGEQLKFYKYAWNAKKTATSRTNETTLVLQDEEKWYVTGGKTFYDVNLQKGTSAIRISDFTLGYDNTKAPIYVKTLIDDTGVNGKQYTSAAVLVYQD